MLMKVKCATLKYLYEVLQRCSGLQVLFSRCKKTYKSNQMYFTCIAQNHNHIASVGFTIYTVNSIICP